MITLISGTNRPHSRTLKVAEHYYNYLIERQQEVRLLTLEELKVFGRNEYLIQLEEEFLMPAEKFIFIMPEYNGSFPGVLKTLLDQTDIRKCWWNKKALLVGLADGRGGNLRGIEHMTNILHYLKMNVHYNKLPISKINEEMDESGKFLNNITRLAIADQLDSFIKY
jgi:NAD(P)H-dependent FMN reductase